jgi:RNA polymerase sigma-70 factor (ECF subfamily)
MTPQQAFDQFHQAVYGFAYRLTRRADLAEDLTQECFLALVRAPQRFDPARGSMKTYLFAIARNLALKHYRDHSAEESLDEDAGWPGPDPRPTPRSSIDVGAAVEAAIARLPPLQQEALVLFEYSGLTLEEMAQVVEAEVGTVKARLHRARANLRRMLSPYRKVGAAHGA